MSTLLELEHVTMQFGGVVAVNDLSLHVDEEVIMDDENKKYFFKSHQVCDTSSRESDLGKVADLDISLEKI